MGAPVIQAEKLVKKFHGEAVLKGVSLTVEEGQLACLIGPSGCGKTTLLRCLNGLEVFEEGRMVVAGVEVEPTHGHLSAKVKEEIKQLRRRVGFVFQQFHLFPHLDVMSNLTLAPVKVLGWDGARAEAKALELLDKVGLKHKARAWPEQLSGGQQQRVAIARGLCMEPKVMLYDEPTSALDPGLRDEVLNVMKGLRAEGITQVVVTHEMAFARDAADAIHFTYAGLIAESGPPSRIFTAPEREETRAFLKKFLD